jgi:ketosteroid isomerase-like protein
VSASSNLDLVRSIYAAWERGDWSSADWAHPEIEYEHVDGPSPGKWRGVPAMAGAFRDWLSAWEQWTREAEEYRELDDERVLVFATSSGRGKSSGLEVGQIAHGADMFRVRGGKVTKIVTYWDRKRALADLGLTQ